MTRRFRDEGAERFDGTHDIYDAEDVVVPLALQRYDKPCAHRLRCLPSRPPTT